jgi:hypothetical protein
VAYCPRDHSRRCPRGCTGDVEANTIPSDDETSDDHHDGNDELLTRDVSHDFGVSFGIFNMFLTTAFVLLPSRSSGRFDRLGRFRIDGFAIGHIPIPAVHCFNVYNIAKVWSFAQFDHCR